MVFDMEPLSTGWQGAEPPVTPRDPLRPSPLVTVAEYLEHLRSTGKLDDYMEEDSDDGEPYVPKTPRSKETREAMQSVPTADAYSEQKTSSPGSSSWMHDLTTPRRRMQRIVVRIVGRSSSQQRTMIFGEISRDPTVGEIKELLWEQLLPDARHDIVIEHWGRMLDPERRLADYALLDARLVEQKPDESRGLVRVRVVSTALATRSIACKMQCTGGALKEAIELALHRGDYKWWDAEGECIRITSGVTTLANESAVANEQAGTSMVSRGEEIIVDMWQAMSLNAGKGTVTGRRMDRGTPAVVSDQMVTVLNLKPHQMKLSFGGVEIRDSDRLHTVGCRTDDAIDLEFESPTQPDQLKLVRSEAPAKPEKKGGGGKKKKK
jgi:hypothetical protein